MFDMSCKTVEERQQIIRKIRQAKSKRYKSRNKQQIQDYNRRYYQANKERIHAQRQAQREAKQKEGASDD